MQDEGPRPLERRAWALTEGAPEGRVARLATRTARSWLDARLRFAIRLRQARYSPRLALRRCLRTGLPAAAVIAATVPVTWVPCPWRSKGVSSSQMKS